jgi:hypothetical protein
MFENNVPRRVCALKEDGEFWILYTEGLHDLYRLSGIVIIVK